MSVSDPIGDMLARIRNAGMIGHPEVAMPLSRMKMAIAEVLKEAGYIHDVRVEGETPHKMLHLGLKYHGGRRDRAPVIEGMKRISKPSCRVYVGAGEIPRARGGLGLVILSTNRGILSDRAARAANVGGEVLCSVW